MHGVALVAALHRTDLEDPPARHDGEAGVGRGFDHERSSDALGLDGVRCATEVDGERQALPLEDRAAHAAERSFELARRAFDRLARRLRLRHDGHDAAVQLLHAVQSDEPHARDADAARQVGDRTSRHDRDRGVASGQPAEDRGGAAHRPCSRRLRHDRREAAVEVAEDPGSVRTRRDAGKDAGGHGHRRITAEMLSRPHRRSRARHGRRLGRCDDSCSDSRCCSPCRPARRPNSGWRRASRRARRASIDSFRTPRSRSRLPK